MLADCLAHLQHPSAHRDTYRSTSASIDAIGQAQARCKDAWHISTQRAAEVLSGAGEAGAAALQLARVWRPQHTWRQMPALRLRDAAAGKQACAHRSPGSFMTLIMTLFFTAGSAIMSFSSCARGEQVTQRTTVAAMHAWRQSTS